MDTIGFISKIENQIIELGFTPDGSSYKLGPYVVNIIEDDYIMTRFGVELINMNNIETKTLSDFNDVIRATTYFNTQSDSVEEINRRFNAVIVNKITNLPKYNIYLRKIKIDNVRST
jgi:hypothetical protein